MSNRPQFWIHRTFRFWSGLALISLILGFSITMGFHLAGVAWFSKSNHPSYASFRGTTYIEGTARTLGFQNGGIFYSREHGVARPAVIPNQPRFIWLEQPGYEFLPSVRNQDAMGWSNENYRLIFIPLWPAIALLNLFWLLWMYRSDRKEDEQLHPNSPEPPSSSNLQG